MKILVADDGFFSHKLLQKMLESAGHTVLVAGDGLKARADTEIIWRRG